MKFAVIFLFALVVISHQQLQRPRGLIFLSPYYSPPQAARPINKYLSPYFNDHLEFFNKDNVGEDEYHQSKDAGPFDVQQQLNGRIFFNSNSNKATVTVTLTTATVQSCIPATQLAAGAVACRRKRRHIRELDDSPIVSDEDTQFSIDPSETLKVTPTALPSSNIDTVRETRQEAISDSLISSKDEGSLNDFPKLNLVTGLREKRLFFNLGNFGAMVSPVTSYVFVPTTILKTVTLGAASSVLCLPAGYAQC